MPAVATACPAAWSPATRPSDLLVYLPPGYDGGVGSAGGHDVTSYAVSLPALADAVLATAG